MLLKHPRTALAGAAKLMIASAVLTTASFALAQSQLANMGPTEVKVPNTAVVRYDTQYKASNDGVIAFDDGQVTRIQLPPGTLIPAFFAVRAQGDVLLTPKQSSTYFVVDGIHSKLNLVWANNRQVTITYMGSMTAERMGAAAAFGAAAPKSVHGSAATPVDTVLQSKVVAASDARTVPNLVEVEKISGTEGAKSTNTMKLGTAPITNIPTEPKPAPVASQFTVNPRDQTISSALFRWCGVAKCQLVWAAEKDLPAMQATYSEDFEVALAQLMTDTKHSDYPLHSCVYENNVVRVLHVMQSCTK